MQQSQTKPQYQQGTIALQRYYSATKSNKTTIPTGDYRPTEVLQCNKVKQNHNTNKGLSPYRVITVQQSQTKSQYQQGTIALQRYYSATKSNKTTIPTGDLRTDIPGVTAGERVRKEDANRLMKAMKMT